MKTNRFFIFAVCCLLTLALAGCGNGQVGDTVSQMASQLGDDISGAVSRVESALDGTPNDNSSGFPDEDEISSMPNYASSQGGGINSGDDNIVNGTESDTVSGTESFNSVPNDGNSSNRENNSEVSDNTRDR